MSNILAERIPNNKCFATLVECIKEIEDPRLDRNKKHPLFSIIIMSICAVIGGANSWLAIEEFGNNHKGWFIRFLDLPYGIPSHDTIGRIFSIIDHRELMGWLWLWLESLHETNDDQIAIDGKVVKAWKSKNSLTILRACAGKSRMILGQVKVHNNSNEITAIPDLLNLLYLKGKIVTIDAIGTQKNIAELIVEKEADYVLPIKGNQHHLHADAKLFLDDMSKNKFDDVYYTYHETENRGHGRHEIRRCWATDNIEWFDEKGLWPKMKSISIIESIRTEKGNTTTRRRYFISSLPADADHILSIVRSHWSIENGPHWSMDLVFEEDRSTTKAGNSPQNFALLRSFCYSLLKNEPAKCSMRAKRVKANINFTYLMKVLLNATF